MDTRSRPLLMTALVLSTAATASAQPGATDPIDHSAPDDSVIIEEDAEAAALRAKIAEVDAAEAQAEANRSEAQNLESDLAGSGPPGTVRPVYREQSIHKRKTSSLIATEERWGGGVRFTGLSGIGALPGVNYGAEVAGYVRHDEMFAELGFGWWRPEKHVMVTEGTEHVELDLRLWSLRGGWAAMHVPLRAWVLVEGGELAGTKGMPSVMARMVSGDMPQSNRWQAVGAGFGVAWPMAKSARLFGMVEFAVPVNRGELMTAAGEYQPDPLAARSSVGLELGWR